MAHHDPSVSDLMRELARDSSDVLSEQELLQRFTARSDVPSVPRSNVRAILRADALSLGWVALSSSLYVPHHIVLDRSTLRCLPSAAEIAEGILLSRHLLPFVTREQIAGADVRDEFQSQLSCAPLASTDGTGMSPGLQLAAWYQRYRMVAGDSILVTIVADGDALMLYLRHEAAADLRIQAREEADQGFLRSLIRTIAGGELRHQPTGNTLLAGHYLFEGRASYPGTPIVFLAEQRGLVQDLGTAAGEPVELSVRDDDAELRSALRVRVEQQAALSERARRADQRDGIWDGTFRAQVTERLQRVNWALRFTHDDTEVDLEPDEELDTLALIEQPDLRQRLLRALPDDAARAIQRVSADEVERIVIQHLNHLLSRDRSLFPLLEPPSAADRLRDIDQLAVLDFGVSLRLATPSQLEVSYDEAEDSDDDEEDFDEATDLYELARDASYQLITDFANHLVELGRSERIITERVGGLILIADYLADTFAMSLDPADYATLDEFLFLYYPGTIVPHRSAVEIAAEVPSLCTTIRQFYLYLRDQGRIDDVRFATAIWRRRTEASAHAQLINELRGSDNALELIPLLFAAYAG